MNSAGPRIDRSTCVSAAKLTIASQPARGPRDGIRVGDVALVEVVLDALEVRPVARVGQLVENDHLVAAAASRRTNCEPMNPAPPVTSTRIGSEPRRSRHARSPSRQCGSSGAPLSLRSTEYAGRGARAPNSAVVIRRTRVFRPASSKIASANSAHVQSPAAATW